MKKRQLLLTRVLILGVFLFFIIIPLQQAYTESKASWKTDFGHLPTTNDVIVELEYDTGGPETFNGTEDNRTRLESGGLSLVLPIPPSDHEYSIFQSPGSHWYGGTLVTVNKSKNRYALSYVGLKTSGADCMGDLTVEIVVEFERGGDYSLRVPNHGFRARLQNLVGSKAYACGGPSWYAKELGKSQLVFFKEANGIRWYELAVPIPLHNIPTGNGAVNDLGEVRMHIDYVPKIPGQLVVEVAALVVKDTKGKYRQAKLVEGSNKEYRAYLALEEQGCIQYIYDNNANNLMIELKNCGQHILWLDELSLDALARSETFAERLLQGFSLDDGEGKSARTLSFQEIKNQLKGKTLQPNQSLHLLLFPISKLPPKSIYSPMIELARTFSKYKAPETRGRIISWCAPPCYYPDGLINGKIKKFLTVDNNDVLFYIDADSHVELVRLYEERNFYQEGYLMYGQLLPVFASWPYETTVPASKFKYHQARSQDIPGFAWGRFLEESPAQYLAKTTGTSIVSRSKDFYGNNLTQYKRGNITGFIVDRSFKAPYTIKVCAQGVLYEIPSGWTKDEKLMALLRWMIRINVLWP